MYTWMSADSLCVLELKPEAKRNETKKNWEGMEKARKVWVSQWDEGRKAGRGLIISKKYK